MASYKNANFLVHNDGVAFDALLPPGTIAHNSGIYRCSGCGNEIAANKDNPLPPQNHHQHSAGQDPIKWQLIVFAVHH
ncbi:hypothetical protein [Stenotrophomonas maltophilia]|uniref:hypothetical protein n=1 Tax=Stenotrophomonas maltophilia TaxID=40324 RepID=UPI003D7E3633